MSKKSRSDKYFAGSFANLIYVLHGVHNACYLSMRSVVVQSCAPELL